MSIKYVLHENHLTPDPDDFRALVQATDTADQDDVVDRIIQQGSTVTRADILSVLEDRATAIENMVLEGRKVTTPLANFGASIKGVFDNPEDSFDPSRHQLLGIVGPGKRYRRTVKDRGQADKRESIKPTPNILSYFDINSGERNSVLTSGGMGRITGHRLKFDLADPEQGVFFTPTGGAPVRVTRVGKNIPGELMFLVPDGLAAGDHELTVRAVFGTDDVRTGTLAATLTVS